MISFSCNKIFLKISPPYSRNSSINICEACRLKKKKKKKKKKKEKKKI